MRAEVHAGGVADGTGYIVQHKRYAESLRQRRDLARLGDAAVPDGVGHDDLRYVLLQPFAQLPARHQQFRADDGDGGTVGERFDFVRINSRHHIFQEEDIIWLEGAGDPLHTYAVPAKVAFNADLHLIADGVADLLDRDQPLFDFGCRDALTEAALAKLIKGPDFHRADSSASRLRASAPASSCQAW